MLRQRFMRNAIGVEDVGHRPVALKEVGEKAEMIPHTSSLRAAW